MRLFEEVRAAGYRGGYGQVKRHVREIRPRPPVEPVERFETEPGHQAQVDFAEFRLPWGKRHALIVVLGYYQLADLKMPGALEALDEVLAGFDGGQQTAAGAIERLLAAQIALRNSQRLEAAMRSSRLPCVRTLDTFDLSFQPTVKREQIDALHELGFLERAENVVFPGPPGVGKTHWRSAWPSLRPGAAARSTSER